MSTKQIEYGFSIEEKGESPPYLHQVHGNTIVELGSRPVPPVPADGLFTHQADTEIFVFTADCLSLLFWGNDPKDPIAAIHCGWKGARAEIARAAVERLRPKTKELHVALGPCLMDCCFEVKDDFIGTFKAATPYLKRRGDRTYFSMLDFVVKEQLKALPPQQVHTEHVRCTFCSEPELPSFRRNKSTNPQIRAHISKAK